jgi:hypothetical protein
VYLLLGPRDDGEGEMLYVGEGDPIRPRLESHYAKKDFWSRAVCFVAARRAAEQGACAVPGGESHRPGPAAKRMPLDNANAPTEPTLSEADRADMQVFLQNMLGMLPVLGVHAFEQAPKCRRPFLRRRMLTAKARAWWPAAIRGPARASWSRRGRGPWVMAVPSMQQHVRGMYELRQAADRQRRAGACAGRRRYRFTQDYVFSSPVYGRGGGTGPQCQRAHRVEGRAGPHPEGVAEKAQATQVAAKKAPAKKTPAKQTPTKKAAVNKVAAKTAPAKKAPAKAVLAKKAAAPKAKPQTQPKAPPASASKEFNRLKTGLTKMGDKRPRKLASFLRHVQAILGKDSSAVAVEAAVQELERANVVHIAGDLVLYS